MSKGYSYFELLEVLGEAGCPICRLVIKDSRSYLDHLLYELVLDVPTRMELLDSFGFCSWHAWQIPALPAICSPDTGVSIFASDLLRKFDHLARAIRDKIPEKRTLKSLFRKVSQRFLPHIKERQCPACRHVVQFQYYRLKELADSIQDEEFLNAYKASPGICLPHFFLLQENCSTHPNFPLLLDLQLAKSKSLRDILEEFIRKQGHRVRHQITQEESRAWKVATEFLVGKPGVFTNEIGHDMLQSSRRKPISHEQVSLRVAPLERPTLGELIDDLKTAREATFCLKRSLPTELFEELKKMPKYGGHPAIEAVVEDFSDVAYLRELYLAGFSLFHGVGLPSETIILLDRRRGFILADKQHSGNRNLRALRNPDDVYLRLLWRRFGVAVLLSGSVTGNDAKSRLFCLAVERGREQWCRLRDSVAKELPKVGANVELFAWEKWNTHILEVLELTVLERGQ